MVDAIEQAKKKIGEAINTLLPEMEKVSEEHWVRAVKESRGER